jgi:hypothetical protein
MGMEIWLGHYGWAVGVGMWAVIIAAMIFGRKKNPNACPQCDHQTGGTSHGCDWVDHANGWSSDPCDCHHSYHASYVAA